ncbi:hypothetical protein J1TS5_04160 [Paenibacillus macerans]|uniref:hypothetical protein n=1 Tax=Paenibacillus macerans TaxID=44252 RepID=UPI001B0D1A1F|nr:hypothetical protein [Paenibacillus macerans]GIP08246.1 hypothetical protein J1TS5_04160 [Paenibacillus macerans]
MSLAEKGIKRLKVVAGLFMVLAIFLMATPVSHAESIKDRLSGGSGEVSGLETQIDKSTNTLVDTARRIFIFLSIVFGIWLALCFFRAGFSPDTLRETKGRTLALLVFLVMSFWTEQILGFFFKILGIDISQYLS